MGMSSYVEGRRNLDGKFKTMLKLKLSCDEAEISYPKEVEAYFDEYSGESEEVLRREFSTIDVPHSDWSGGDMEQGFCVKVKDIPKEVKEIIFYNSY